MAFILVVSSLLGLAVGSFCNVVIYRVPRRLSVVRPASHCPSCSTPLAPWDNIPVLSWMALRGRCRSCSQPISPRYVLVEIVTATLFALVAWRLGPVAILPAYWVLVAGLVSIAAVDLERYLVPNRILYPTLLLGSLLLIVGALIDNSWHALLGAALGGVVAFAALFLIHLVQPKGMGFGDVRLAGLLGVFLGWFGLPRVGVGLFLGFVLGAVAGLLLMAFGGATRRTKLPFAPFLSAGGVLAVLWGAPVVRFWLG